MDAIRITCPPWELPRREMSRMTCGGSSLVVTAETGLVNLYDALGRLSSAIPGTYDTLLVSRADR